MYKSIKRIMAVTIVFSIVFGLVPDQCYSLKNIFVLDGHAENIIKIAKLSDNMVIDSKGDLYSWGDDDNGTGTIQLKPVKILSNVKKSDNIYAHKMVLTQNGDLYTWGYNEHGEVGNGTFDNQMQPTKIMSGVVDIYDWFERSAAITENGDLFCWGINNKGVIGNNTRDDANIPIKVLSNVKEFSLDSSCSVAVTNDGELYFWGYLGTWGYGEEYSDYYQLSPQKIMDGVKACYVGTFNVYAISDDDKLYKFKLWQEIDDFEPEFMLENVDRILDDGMIITKDDSLYTWGSNSWGQLGNDSDKETYSYYPVKVLENVKNAGTYSVATKFAITKDNELYCWGYNAEGEVGNGNKEDQFSPVKILDNVKYADGDYAVCTNGDFYCWLYTYSAMYSGEEDVLIPTKVLSNIEVAQNNQALSKDGVLYRWGDNSDGWLGNGSTESKNGPSIVLFNGSTDSESDDGDNSESDNNTDFSKENPPTNDTIEELDIAKVYYKYGTIRKDVLSKAHSIENDHSAFNINCEFTKADDVKKVELYSGDKKIAETKDGNFKDVDPSKFIEGKTVSLKVYGNSKVLTKTTMLEVKNKNVLMKSSIGLSDEALSFTLSDDVPLIGGSEMNFNFPNIPVNAVVEDGKIKIGYNIKKKNLYDYNSYEGVTTTTKEKTMAQKVSDWKKDMYKTKMISKDMKGYLEKGNLKADIPGIRKKLDCTVFGYAEGTWSDSIEKISGELVIVLEGYETLQKQFVIMHVPMTVNVKFTGKGEASAKVEYDFTQNELKGDLGLSTSVSIEPYLGVGVGTWFSAGIYGNAEVGTDFTIVSASNKKGVDGPGLDSVYLYGEAGLKAYFAKKTVGKVEIISTKGLKKTGLKDYVDSSNHLLLYSRKENSLLNKKQKTTKSTFIDSQNVNSYNNLEEMFVWEEDVIPSFYSAPEAKMDNDVLIENIYGASTPQLASVKNKTIISYVNEIKERSLANQTAAQFIVYDELTGEYTEPNCIIDDGTADYNLQMYSDGENLYAYYLDSIVKYQDNDDPELEEYAESFGLRVAKFDSDKDTFVNVGLLHVNYSYCPYLTGTSDGFVVAWVDNESNNIMGLSSDNSIYYAEYDGNKLSKPICLESNLSSVTSLAVCKEDGNCRIAYCMDKDNDISTNDEQLAVLDSMGNKDVVSDGAISDLSYTSIPGITYNVIACVSDGTISYIDSNTNELKILDNNIVIGNSCKYQVIGDNIYFLDNCVEKNSRDISMIHYEDGKYKKVVLTNSDSYIDCFSTNGQWIVHQSTIASFDDDGQMITNSDLKLIRDFEKNDLKVEYVDFDCFDVKPGEVLPVTVKVKNDGTNTITQMEVLLLDENKNILNSTMINDTLIPGDSIEKDVDVLIPDELTEDAYYIRVINTDDSDSNIAYNDTEIDLSLTDLSVKSEYCIDEQGNRSIEITVSNESYVGANASVELVDEENNKVYTTTDFIEGKDQKIVVIPLENNMIPKDENGVLFKVHVNSDKKEYYDCNNDDDLRAWNIAPPITEIEEYENVNNLSGDEQSGNKQNNINPSDNVLEENGGENTIINPNSGKAFDQGGSGNEVSDISTTIDESQRATASKNIVPKPGKTKIKSIKNSAKKSMKISWKKIKSKGYEVQIAYNKNFTKSKKSKITTKTSLKIKKLKKGKLYYVRVRAFNIDSEGTKEYGKWSDVKKVKVKK